MNSRDHLEEVIFNFIVEHHDLDYAESFDYSDINDILDKIDGSN